MARYADLLGRRVEIQYRVGDMLLPATGILAADSGRSVFIEEHFVQQRQLKKFRWEVPYQSIVRLEESGLPEPVPSLPWV